MNMMTELAADRELLSDNPRRDIRIGGAIAFFFFVVLLGWAAFAPLDAGVRGSGHIAISGNRQAVQHRDGGVVNAIHVREGQHVRQGQVLVEMAAPDLKGVLTENRSLPVVEMLKSAGMTEFAYDAFAHRL